MAVEKVTISFPPDLLQELDAALKEDGRGRSTTFQKWARDYLRERKIQERIIIADSGSAEFINNGTELEQWVRNQTGI